MPAWFNKPSPPWDTEIPGESKALPHMFVTLRLRNVTHTHFGTHKGRQCQEGVRI